MNFSKNYFTLKGKKAEAMVYDLASKTFLMDWCFLNPKFPDGKELCDLLVVFDNIVIIWQIKNLKLNKKGRYKKAEVEKNLRQLYGAKRRLIDLKTEIELENPRRRKERFDPQTIKEIYLISVLMGEGEEFFNAIGEYKNHTIHVFTGDFTEVILNELDTITDFTEYLRAKEKLIEKTRILVRGEEQELLALYLQNNRSFDWIKEDMIVLEGLWENFQKSEEYVKKKEEDKISYLWDRIINRAHEAAEESPHYEKIARELARPNRFKRRILSKIFCEAHKRAHKDNRSDVVHRRTLPEDGTTYCFLFQDDPTERRERRKSILSVLCMDARCRFQKNKKVLGIATEKKIRRICSYDFCLLEIPKWTKEWQQKMEKLQKDLGMSRLNGSRISYMEESEYPKSQDK